ncbi:hypothetical protein P171DRAFT_147895 [Karstenula rhodostoma CBS 690.94]|uniref:Uncharacterized protein n=1 Tax=Karstenula rhodostoma CBS 690.94 TaxID=1392251 RepID=A0A9P4PX02_9PLEO|nr:hypothetical protein P171DRAFT_147895 [Karstenula rhodostoma CBS 690.94]
MGCRKLICKILSANRHESCKILHFICPRSCAGFFSPAVCELSAQGYVYHRLALTLATHADGLAKPEKIHPQTGTDFSLSTAGFLGICSSAILCPYPFPRTVRDQSCTGHYCSRPGSQESDSSRSAEPSGGLVRVIRSVRATSNPLVDCRDSRRMKIECAMPSKPCLCEISETNYYFTDRIVLG